MPTYQYTCTECGEPVEALQKFTDESLTECPACGGKLRKVFSPVGIVFKGSGFYRTDSRKSAKSEVGSSSTSASSTSTESSSKDSGTADKPAAEKPAETASASAKSSSSSSGEKVA